MNYLDCISENFPTVIFVCNGDPHNYDDVEWLGGDELPPKEILDSLIFAKFKNDKIAELSKACNQVIISGFTSNALGYDCIYDSEEVDQLNITGVLTMISPTPDNQMGYSAPYAVRPIVDGVVTPKVYLTHSYFQLRKALTDGGTFKLVMLQKFNDKRDLVSVADTIDKINNITLMS